MKIRPESEIMKSWPKGYDVPLVTVLTISYCHEKYLRTALDSILSQETNFPFEVVVHDDASPDGSAAIIREYAEKYPHIIRPIIEDENQYSKGVQAIMRAVKSYIRGRYIAYLDCDDYWTDVHKLQEQVDYLEAHPAFLAVAHNCTIVDEDGVPTGEQYPECYDEEFTAGHFFNETLAGQLGTFIIRDIFTQAPDDHPLIVSSLPGPFDRVLNLTLLLNGRVHCIQKSMSAYRYVTGSGTSFSATYQYDIKREARFYLAFVDYCKEMGRIGDAIGMLRWFINFTENYTYDSPESHREAETLLESCRSSISSLVDQLAGHSNLPYADIESKLAQSEADRQALVAQLEASTEQLSAVTEQLEATKAQLSAVTGQLEASKAQLSASKRELSQSTEQLEATTAQLSQATEQLKAVRNDYDMIFNSTFWKITKPARVFLDAIRRFLR